jgi:protein-S-isoprenylcysteine O-methyltransferase Ste14
VNLVDLLCSVTTGSERRRRVLTPVFVLFALGLLLLPVVASRFTDRVFAFPALLPGVVGTSIGAVLLGVGLALWGWSMALFKGRGVPANPPRDLVAVGPYAWVRNPMLLGLFVAFVGLGFVLHSVSLVFIWTPAVVSLIVIELKLVEEPELERRLGAPYTEYRKRVPMLIPRRPRLAVGSAAQHADAADSAARRS